MIRMKEVVDEDRMEIQAEAISVRSSRVERGMTT